MGSHETDPAASNMCMCACVCFGCADNTFRVLRTDPGKGHAARGWAGPQCRVGSLVRQKIGRAGGSLGIIIFAPSTLASLQQGCKDVARGATGLLQQVPPYHWHGCRKIRSFFWLRRWFGRHLWHPSDRAMMTRLFHLAPSIEQPGESVRDIAWWARGLEEGEDGAGIEHWVQHAGRLCTRMQACR